MKNLKQDLWRLQGINVELGPGAAGDHPEAMAFRQRIPASVLSRFDQMLARGKRPVATVRGGVCAECHLRITKADLMALVAHSDLRQCGNCGRFLYLSEEEALALVPSPAPAEPPVRRGRHRQPVHA
jgi:hypothetical protein